ncbi:MAG: hypothetical protein EOP46_01300 [Sphingobacteriaceae bacterium]|nr:MAG: hypothetical protein EOP46_01300 [Sphingobacteriaceae bacterium]
MFSKTISTEIDGNVLNKGLKVSQVGTGYYVSSSISTVVIYIDPYSGNNLPSMQSFLNEINGAVSLWNNVPNTRLKFSITTDVNAPRHIIMISAFLANCGDAYFPVNGLPGSMIRINTMQFAGRTFEQKRRTIAHEMGHTIGLMHTEMSAGIITADENGSPAVSTPIPGTPATDNTSIMNGGQCNSGATVLSAYDIQAFQYLYPAPLPPATISGPRYVCSSGVYSLSNIPSYATVVWSTPSSAGSVLQLSQNQPSPQKLTITNQGWYQITTTLTATVTTGSNPPVTYSMPVSNDAPVNSKPYNQSACTYLNVSHPAQSGTVSANSTTFVHSGCSVQVYLQLPSNKKIVLGTGGIPLYWSHSGPYLFFALPVNSQGTPFVFNIVPIENDGSCSSTLTFKTYSNNQ